MQSTGSSTNNTPPAPTRNKSYAGMAKHFMDHYGDVKGADKVRKNMFHYKVNAVFIQYAWRV